MIDRMSELVEGRGLGKPWRMEEGMNGMLMFRCIAAVTCVVSDDAKILPAESAS
jgi:hypothetical protein